MASVSIPESIDGSQNFGEFSALFFSTTTVEEEEVEDDDVDHLEEEEEMGRKEHDHDGDHPLNSRSIPIVT